MKPHKQGKTLGMQFVEVDISKKKFDTPKLSQTPPQKVKTRVIRE
tara:strand:+ start:2112 stop:2246 length:135 start_codon:yes stop_codon:yes gene_type:complete